MKDLSEEFPDLFVLRTVAQWKAFSHPLRLRILERLAEKALTNEELAAALKERSGKLYFHTKLLLDAGLIVLDETREKSRVTEKMYHAVARRFVAMPPASDADVPPLERALTSALELYRSDWKASNGLPGELQRGFHVVLNLSADARRELAQRIQDVFDDFQASSSDAPDACRVSLAVEIHSFGATGSRADAIFEENNGYSSPADGAEPNNNKTGGSDERSL